MKYAFAFLATGLFFQANAQIPALATQFPATLIHVNPAYTGLQYQHAANVLHGSQWITNGAPVNSLYANYALRIDKIRSGIGFSYSMDQAFMTSSQVGAIHLAHHFKTGENASLSVGLTGGVRSFALTPSAFKEPFQDYYAAPELNAGIAYHWQDLNAGISFVQFNQPKFESRHYQGAGSDYNVPLSCWLTADYTFHLSEKFDLRPQLQVAVTNQWGEQTFGIAGILHKRFWFGANYNYDSFIGFMIGYDIRERFRIGFSQDFYTDELTKWMYGSDGQFELNFSYLLQ